MKNKIYRLIEEGDQDSGINLTFDYAIMILIVLNVIAIILETIPEMYQPLKGFLRVFEIISVSIFSVEYLLRIYISDLTHPSSSRFKSVLKFVFSSYGLIDLIAIIPFYTPFLITIDLRFLRIFRFMRFMRILKINRYTNSLNLIWTVIKEKKSELAITGFVTLLTLVFASFLMYYIEGEAQPEKFPNIIASFWWAIATLTTVTYGDVFLITGFGKFVSGLIAVLGIGLVALPTGLITAGFIQKIGKSEKKTKKCPHCGKDIIE